MTFSAAGPVLPYPACAAQDERDERMKLYHNIMEDVVEEAFDQLKASLDLCPCDQCRNDVIAFALNNLPPRYAVTSSGSAISKAASLNIQYHADVQAAVIRGAEVVRQHPRHK